MHGKSVVDGIGSTVKRRVRQKVLSGKDVVQSAEDFVNSAKSSSMNIEVELMKISEINARNEAKGLKKIVSDSKNVKNIKKNHCFEVGKVLVRKKHVDQIIAHKITPGIP
jgi:hypothetical protein